MQSLSIHSISGISRKPVKKVSVYVTLLLTMKSEVEYLLNRNYITYNRKGHRAFAVFLLSFFIGICRMAVSSAGCRSPPFQSGFLHFQKFRLEEIRMAYNHGREDRKWRIWKEAEEKVLREHGVDEAVIEQIRIEDRADFNSNRRFYRWTSDFGEYLEGMADTEQQAEPNTVADLLDEIENETLYQTLLTVDKHTLLILLLKMQGYSTREIAAMAGLTERAVYKRLERLRKKLKPIFYPFGEI
ncbi:RNA polymerase sigma factor, sigma-70 family [Marvinbryantia formatexigens DSM 14469]|uniref:RNA polymerase sigma factor, sigma-70 family n=2 Tax=Lachnospiraceae TaxID=186803 RepID=C6LJ46_9FIRM|nr:RNA polymerase sigma factor, sigma-70 family [Marvinbryantia formatexigens DSM 14469]